MYEQLKNGKDYENVLETLADHVTSVVSDIPAVDVDELTNYDRMKTGLMVQIVNSEANKEMLENVPHHDIEDMSLVYRMELEKNENGIASILVTNDILGVYGISPEQLHEDALAQAEINRPATFRSLETVMRELMGDMADLMPPMNNGPQMYVASVEGSVNGAGVISYPGFMDRVVEEMGGDVYILPSSLHEVLILPDDGSVNRRDLEKMVREVNATEVLPEDKLSDHVYHYDSQDKVFEMAEKFEARQAAKEYSRGNHAAEKPEGRGSVLAELNDRKEALQKEKTPKTKTAGKQHQESL